MGLSGYGAVILGIGSLHYFHPFSQIFFLELEADDFHLEILYSIGKFGRNHIDYIIFLLLLMYMHDITNHILHFI